HDYKEQCSRQTSGCVNFLAENEWRFVHQRISNDPAHRSRKHPQNNCSNPRTSVIQGLLRAHHGEKSDPHRIKQSQRLCPVIQLLISYYGNKDANKNNNEVVAIFNPHGADVQEHIPNRAATDGSDKAHKSASKYINALTVGCHSTRYGKYHRS